MDSRSIRWCTVHEPLHSSTGVPVFPCSMTICKETTEEGKIAD
jgi:hypothetical protein